MKLHSDFINYFGDKNAFDKILNLNGKIFREHKNRKTLQFTKDGRGYFVKIHRGIGLKEIFKNLFDLRCPVLSTQNEVNAIRRLEEIGVETMKMAGFGVRGVPPAWLDSFIITEELENTVSLEDFSRDWPSRPPDFFLKLAIIRKVADIARRLHANGINHRDFYICHFLFDPSKIDKTDNYNNLHLYLIDLHRVQLRRRTPERWIIKDLAALFFSSMDIGLNRRDIFRFMKAYSEKPLRTILKEERLFWHQVYRRAVRLYKKHFQTNSQIKGIFPP